MTDFKASVEFPDLNIFPSVGDIDQSKLTIGDEVYITEQQVIETPPIYDFPMGVQYREPPLTKEIFITEFYCDVTAWRNEYIPILRDNAGNTLLAYNGVEEKYKLRVLDQSGNYVTIYREDGNEGHTAAYAQGSATVNVRWLDDGSSIYQLSIRVNTEGESLPLDGSEVMSDYPTYGGVYSRGFRDLIRTLSTNYEHEYNDANLVTYETTDTDIIDRKMVYSGEGLIDVTTPVAIEYEGDNRVYHNQTVLADTLTEDATLVVDDLATHFRVLYSEDAEVDHTMSLSFLNDTFTLGYAGDDVTFTKFNDDDTWFYTNQRNNEKGAF